MVLNVYCFTLTVVLLHQQEIAQKNSDPAQFSGESARKYLPLVETQSLRPRGSWHKERITQPVLRTRNTF